MFRLLFRLILLLAAAAIIYGLWLLYQGKSPEEKAEFREGLGRTAKSVGRTAVEAGRKVVEKGQQVLEESREGERE